MHGKLGGCSTLFLGKRQWDPEQKLERDSLVRKVTVYHLFEYEECRWRNFHRRPTNSVLRAWHSGDLSLT